MTTRQIINKLPENVLARVERYREFYARPFTTRIHDEIRNRMSGYVLGLRDAGLITERERQLLFVYMTVAPSERV